jgi:hypothetical protein
MSEKGNILKTEIKLRIMRTKEKMTQELFSVTAREKIWN